MPSFKKIVMPVALLVGGLGVGGGAAYATAGMLGLTPKDAGVAAPEKTPTTFVQVDNVLAPLVLPDGERLAGYVSFSLALEVPEERAEEITARLPMLRHEMNMRTYRTLMSSGPDGTVPNLEAFRKVVRESCQAAFGKDAVRNVAIVAAQPA